MTKTRLKRSLYVRPIYSPEWFRWLAHVFRGLSRNARVTDEERADARRCAALLEQSAIARQL